MGVNEERNKNLTHLLFVDDMKLYASNLEKSEAAIGYSDNIFSGHRDVIW